MNKKVWLISMMIFVTSLVACRNEEEIQGINLFNKDKNYALDYIAEDKTLVSGAIGESVNGQFFIIRENGSVQPSSINTYLDPDGDKISVRDNDIRIEDAKAVYISEDYHSICDLYYDTSDYLDRDEKVMAFLLDGFSYDQYKNAKKEDTIPFLEKYFRNEAISVYQPVTNAGFAAMITGETPDINGIHNRDYREMKIESIFGYAERIGKKSLLLEADIKILNTEIEPLLHFDDNNDGDIDDEIFQTAIKKAEEDYDLIFIHFHGIDDRGHSFGPDDDRTMEYIEKIDGYVEEISKVWDGNMILTADHGMHTRDSGGNHGECRCEDMLVPYFEKVN